MTIKKKSCYTTEQLVNEGWKHSHNIGRTGIWFKDDEVMFYDTPEGLVLSIEINNTHINENQNN